MLLVPWEFVLFCRIINKSLLKNYKRLKVFSAEFFLFFSSLFVLVL